MYLHDYRRLVNSILFIKFRLKGRFIFRIFQHVHKLMSQSYLNPPECKESCAIYDRVEKVNLGKDIWNPKRKIGLSTHFSATMVLRSIKVHHNVWYFLQN